MPATFLSIYLKDHLAGASAGVSLARRAASRSEGTPAGRRLAQVAHEIEDDRETLVLLMSRLGIRGSLLKNGAARLAGQAARLKLNGRHKGDALQRMLELEALSLGIAGKQALWNALRMAPEVAAVANIDLDALEERAHSQRARVELERMALARLALHLWTEAKTLQQDEARVPDHNAA